TAGDGWTIDNNLGRRPEDLLILDRCDTIVWLDLPRWVVHGQVVRRTISRIVRRESLWHGNVETWRMLFSRESIVWWSLRTFRRRRRAYRAMFADPTMADKRRIRLASRGQVNAWLASVGSARPATVT